MAKTRLKKKSRKQLLEQIASKQGLNEVKDICEEEGILLTDAYNYIAPKETNTSEAVEKTDTVDEILAQDDLRVFSEDDKRLRIRCQISRKRIRRTAFGRRFPSGITTRSKNLTS